MIRSRRPIVSSAGETRSNGSVSHAGNSSTWSAPSIGTRSPASRSASAAVGTASRIGRAPVSRWIPAVKSARAASDTATTSLRPDATAATLGSSARSRGSSESGTEVTAAL